MKRINLFQERFWLRHHRHGGEDSVREGHEEAGQAVGDQGREHRHLHKGRVWKNEMYIKRR